MPASCSPIQIPPALELKESPRPQQTPRFIPASHMPKRQANSLPFQDSILHILPTNTHAVSSSANPSRPTLRGVCDPMRRNIAHELEHSAKLPEVYEEEDAIWTMGKGSANLPGTPYLSSRHSKMKPWQGSPSIKDHTLELPPLIPQTAAEYRRRNLIKKFNTPFSHEHGVWDDPPLDLEAVAQAQKRGPPLSKRERVGRLILGLLGSKEAVNKYQERGREREASMDSFYINDVVGIPIPYSRAIARKRSLEMRQQAIKLVGTIRRRKLSLQPGRLNAGQYEKFPLASLEPSHYSCHTPRGSDNSGPVPRGASLGLTERRDNLPHRVAQNEEHAGLFPQSTVASSHGDRNWVVRGTCRYPSPVEIIAGDSGLLVSESDTDDTDCSPASNSDCSPPVFQKQSYQQPQRLHPQHTTLDIVVESEEGQIVSKESYYIPCGPPVFTGPDVSPSPPTNAVADPVDRVHFSQFHGDNRLDAAAAMKTDHAPVSAVPIPQMSSEARVQPRTPTTSVIEMTENETLVRSHMSSDLSSTTPRTIRSHSIAHKQSLSERGCFPDGAGALDCHQNCDSDRTTCPEIDWFRMGALLQIPDRAAAHDEYHRIKRKSVQQLRNIPDRHRNPAYAKFKAEYRLRKQDERDEERRIRALAKQNAEAAMYFQELEGGSDLERRRASSGSRRRARVRS